MSDAGQQFDSSASTAEFSATKLIELLAQTGADFLQQSCRFFQEWSDCQCVELWSLSANIAAEASRLQPDHVSLSLQYRWPPDQRTNAEPLKLPSEFWQSTSPPARLTADNDIQFLIPFALDTHDRQVRGCFLGAHSQGRQDGYEAVYQPLLPAAGGLLLNRVATELAQRLPPENSAADTTPFEVTRTELCETQERYRLATTYSDVSVWEWNLQTGKVIHDGNLNRMLGLTEQNNETFDYWLDAIHPDDREAISVACQLLVEKKQIGMQFRKRMRHNGGGWRWMECQARYKHNRFDSGIVIGTDRDITALVEQNEQISQLEKELAYQTQLALVGELTTGISHEVSQPVSAIRNYAAAALKLINQQEQESGAVAVERITEHLQQIENNAQNISEVIEGVRGILSTEHFSTQQFTRVSFSSVVEQSLTLLRSTIRDQEIQLKLSTSDKPAYCFAHPQLLTQVIVNLVNNSYQALSNSTNPQKVIELRLFSNEDWIGLWVIDNGPGIPDAIRPHIFEPFRSSKPTGMGIGLTISKRIMEAHSGSICLDRQDDSYTRFEIRLPAA